MRRAFVEKLAQLEGRDIYYLDESGIDRRLQRVYARAPRGEKVYADVHGNRGKRVSILSASKGHKLVMPLVFEGCCNASVVDAYFEKMLLPALPKGSVIVLDNASFHKAKSTAKIVEQSGCELLFLPTYSPDLNPIEHIWATLKRALSSMIQDSENVFATVTDMSKCYC